MDTNNGKNWWWCNVSIFTKCTIYIAPPVAAVFLLGILWKRVNSNAAITTLLAGLVLLVLRLGSEIYYQAEINNNIALDNFMYLFATINFSHMAIIMFVFSVLLCISVAVATSPPNYEKIRGLSFGTLSREQKIENNESYDLVDLILSILLVIIVIGILSYFTG